MGQNQKIMSDVPSLVFICAKGCSPESAVQEGMLSW
jgi:hypothetical protein